jgi:hypothetical protein
MCNGCDVFITTGSRQIYGGRPNQTRLMGLSDSLLYEQATNKARNNLPAFLKTHFRISVGSKVIPGGKYGEL